MERKTAVAAATGVSMAVLSATFAVAAGVGALGFGSAAHPAPVATTVATTPGAAATAPVAAVRTVVHEGGEHEGRDSAPAATTTNVDTREGRTSHD